MACAAWSTAATMLSAASIARPVNRSIPPHETRVTCGTC